MLTAPERRRLESDYGGSTSAPATLAKCAAGLLIIVGIAAIGTTGNENDPPQAGISASRVATGH